MNDHLYSTTLYSCCFMALKALVKSGSCLTDDVSSICQQKHVLRHTMGWFFIVLCPNALLFMSANLFKLCARVWFFFGRAKGWKRFYGLFVLSTIVNILWSCSKVKVQCSLMYSLLVSHLMISFTHLGVYSPSQLLFNICYNSRKHPQQNYTIYFSYHCSHTYKCNKSKTDWGQRFKSCYCNICQ